MLRLPQQRPRRPLHLQVHRRDVLSEQVPGAATPRRQVPMAAAALGTGLACGIIGRLAGGAAFLFGAATFAALTAAVLQQALP